MVALGGMLRALVDELTGSCGKASPDNPSNKYIRRSAAQEA